MQYNSPMPYNSGFSFGDPGQHYEIQVSLNILAYGNAVPPLVDAQQAANAWAGTTALDLDTLAALNFKNKSVTTWAAWQAGGYPMLDFNLVCNQLNSSTLLDAQEALSQLAGGL